MLQYMINENQQAMRHCNNGIADVRVGERGDEDAANCKDLATAEVHSLNILRKPTITGGVLPEYWVLPAC